MILPLVPLVAVVGGGITGVGGVVAGTVGGVQIWKAETQKRHHAERYEKRHASHLAEVERTNGLLQAFGQTQERAQREVIFRMRDFLERHHKQVRANEHLILDGVGRSDDAVVGMVKLTPDVAGWVRGVVGSIAVGSATRAALPAAVKHLAKAGTGTPNLCPQRSSSRESNSCSPRRREPQVRRGWHEARQDCT